MKVPKPKVVKDPAYLAYVRRFPCWCYQRPVEDALGGFTNCRPEDTIGHGPSEASHLDGKSRDDRILPMCGGCHRTSRWSWHRGQRSFCRYFGISKTELIREAEGRYWEWKAR